jgi:hypothetical protein
MAMSVVTLGSGGRPVVDVTALGHKFIGRPVTEALNGIGQAVTKVAAGGEAVTFLVVKTDGTPHPK